MSYIIPYSPFGVNPPVEEVGVLSSVSAIASDAKLPLRVALPNSTVLMHLSVKVNKQACQLPENIFAYFSGLSPYGIILVAPKAGHVSSVLHS